jgi:hypothetical protein
MQKREIRSKKEIECKKELGYNRRLALNKSHLVLKFTPGNYNKTPPPINDD